MGQEPSDSSPTENAYWKTLMDQVPEMVCRRTLAGLDAEKVAYLLRVVDLTYKIAPRERTIAQEPPGLSKISWETRLLILAYLVGAMETSLVGRWTSPVEFSGGELFFSADAHNLAFHKLQFAFKSPRDFLAAGEKIGGKPHSIGDSSFVLQTLPRIPILFIYWTGDEELPSKISVLVDESARSHLAIDGLWLAIKASEKRLLEAADSQTG